MNVLAYLEKARSRPEGERKRLALLWSASITFMIFALWFVHFTLTPGVPQKVAVEPEAEKEVSAVSEAVNRIKAGWKEIFN
jgi:hypothetical protein